ncbi:hypothetical protein HCH_06536 [Hahella chejuensis KCTC 2396]|uniref:Uncharacterized protein n=1 Tax=Hahella chejuensis (strain KCTC 2396) TaxID=349521 RepID=Q2S849_HAHCH|nr:hypothetical protein HCH_06536 [Hahella chejuensis KCTC 2396]
MSQVWLVIKLELSLGTAAPIAGALILVELFLGGDVTVFLGVEAFCADFVIMIIAATLLLVLNPHIAATYELKESDMADFYIRKFLRPSQEPMVPP